MSDTLARNYSALGQLTLARLREFYREPAAIFWVYAFPLILALILGFAFQNRPVERVPVDVAADGPGGAAKADEFAARLRTDPRLQVTVVETATGRDRVRTGKTGLLLTPADAAPGWGYLIDPKRPDSVLAQSAAEIALLRAANPALPAAAVAESNDLGGRYIDFLMPGLMGANLMGGGLFGVGFVVVDMRVRKLLKRYVATPMSRRDFLLSLMLSRLLFTLVEITVLLVASRAFFGIAVRGSVPALAGVILLGGVAFTGIGLLVASRARTIETVSGLMNLVMLPMYVLGGVFFPVDRFPESVQPLLQALPLTALNAGLRAVINEGGSWAAVAQPCGVLAAWGAVCFTAALRLFRWQ